MSNQFKLFELCLYADNEKHLLLIEQLKFDFKDYQYILHDKDTFEDTTDDHLEGDIKKAHYHFLVKSNKFLTLSGLSKKYEIEPNLITIKSNLNQSLLYHLHLTNNSIHKVQYNITDLKGTLVDKTIKLAFATQQERYRLSYYEDLTIICDFIDSQKFLTLKEVRKFCIENDYLYCLMRADNYLFKYIREHNELIRS